MKQIITELEALRRRGRVLLLAQRASVLLAWVVGMMLALIAVDYVLRLPSAMRLVLLTGGAGATIYFAWRYVSPAARFRPTLTQIALRAERLFPAVAGRLASSVEFAAAGVDQTNTLASHSVRDTEGRLTGASMRGVINPALAVRDLALMAVVLIGAAAFALANPAGAQTGVMRILLPYSNAQWPARTGAESLMHEVVIGAVHPRGQTLALRARVTRGDHGQRVMAQYRLRLPGAEQFGEWQSVVLTRQGNTAVHERLIDANAAEIELHFITHDARTEAERIVISPPPAVHRAWLTVAPPEYAAGRRPLVERDMGPGTDRRAVTDTPSLIGSQAQFTLHMNKPLPLPMRGGNELDAWIARTFGLQNVDHNLAFYVDRSDPRRWTLTWTLTDTVHLSLDLIDEHGLVNVEPIVYRIEAVEDQPPSVTVTRPQSDELVLATAVVPLAAEAQDDVAVASIALEARVQRREGMEAREGAEEQDKPAWRESREADAPTAQFETSLDLSALSLREGDVVLVTAAATDVFAEGASTHRLAYSAPRRLRIISETEFASHLRRQLGVVRQNAIRVESLQHELQEGVMEDGVQPGIDRAQAQVAERIAAQRQSVDELQRQMRENRLSDQQMESLLQQSRDLLDFAGRAATRAVDEIAHGEDTQAVLEHQQEVREELADLIELLDRDEDTWVMTRRLEGLLDEQSRLEDATADLSRRTVGQDAADLSREDLTELDRIAQRQRELRDLARQLVEDLRRRAEAMERVDQRAAGGMRSAARTAEERELDRDMEAAADRARQNQLRTAQSSQQAANETMRRMLQDMQETQQARAEQLLRQLASLIESIERLIVLQENELSALIVAIDTGEYTGRDRAMIRLNQNTQAVAAEARAAGQQSRRIARALDRAADAQGAAVTALRSDPVRAEAAREAEERSLELLHEAKRLAEELEQQTQEDAVRQRREALVEAYRALAERQIVLRGRTLELAGVEHERLDRRQLMEARRLGSQQDEIRTGLEDLERGAREVLESPVFAHTHRMIARWSGEVTAALNDGGVNRPVTDRQQMIAQAIGRLIEALEDAMAPPPEFDEGQQEGGGGGDGEQQLIPDIAQLRLLRGLQEEVYNHTRSIDGERDLDAAQRADTLRELGRQQRELMELGRDLLESLQRGP